MIRPKHLSPGDTVGIIATARKLKPSDLKEAIEIISGWGLEIITGDHLYSVDHQFAGTDGERTSDLQQMLYDRSIKAIFCARGGYGTARILDGLDFRSFNSNPKWICGFSDVCALHAHVQQQLNCESLHMPMPLTFPITSIDAIERCRRVLFGDQLSYELKHDPHNREGKCKGELIGGNLSVLFSLLGSDSFPDTKDRVLFLEDLDEYLYHIDRMIIGLKRAGKLNDLAGLIIGGFNEMRDNEIPFGKSAHEIICEAIEEFDFPIVANMPCGHIKNNMPLILGGEITIEVAEKSKLVFS